MPSNPAFVSSFCSYQAFAFCVARAADLGANPLRPIYRNGLANLYSGRSGQRGALISGRFRARKLVGSGEHSKCFFAGAHQQLRWAPLLSPYAFFQAVRARGTPFRSDRGGLGASPAPANNPATALAWPAPNSTTITPSGASKAGVL